MKQYVLACLLGATLLTTPVLAQQSNDFVTQQTNNEWRASKLSGVAVYSTDNQKVGTIDDVLLKSDGTASTIVIGSGGVLGAGQKDVAVPFDSVKWTTQGRTVAAGGGSMATQNPGEAQTTAQQGYPDRAELQMSKSVFDGAPAFKYSSSSASK